jgi:hypothetical protein
MTRAQGLSIETIIIAALLLMVLIIVGTLVVRQGVTFGKGTSACESQDGKCLATVTDCVQNGGQPLSLVCPQDKPACCRL